MKLYDPRRDGPVLKNENQVIVSIWTSEENKAIKGCNVGHISIQMPTEYISLWPGPREETVSASELNKLQLAIRPITNNFEQRPPNFKAGYRDDAVAEALSEGDYRQIAYFSDLVQGEVCVLLRQDQVSCCDNAFLKEKGDELFAVKPLDANVRIALYGLDIPKMLKKFDALKKDTPGWRMIGSNGLSRLVNSKSAENCASIVLRVLQAGGMYADLSSALSSQTSSVVKPDVLLKQVIAAKEKEINVCPESINWVFTGSSNLAEIKAAYQLVNDKANAEESLGSACKSSNK